MKQKKIDLKISKFICEGQRGKKKSGGLSDQFVTK